MPVSTTLKFEVLGGSKSAIESNISTVLSNYRPMEPNRIEIEVRAIATNQSLLARPEGFEATVTAYWFDDEF